MSQTWMNLRNVLNAKQKLKKNSHIAIAFIYRFETSTNLSLIDANFIVKL